MRVEVTEHQLIERECGCGHRSKASAPGGAEAPACYGPRIAAIIIYLDTGQFLSKKRTAQALAELFGVPVSSGTVAAVTGRAAVKLDGFLERARKEIAASEVAGFDETGFRVDGRLAWVHCARTGKYTLLMVHDRRGTKAIEAMGVLGSFTGTAVHDAWAPYDGYANAAHQLCCAHVRRELQAVTDAAPKGEWCWATQAADAVTEMQRLVVEAIAHGRDTVDPEALAEQVTRYRSAALAGASQTAPRRGKLMKKHNALPAGPPGRLSAVHPRLPDPRRQQRNRAGHPDGQAPAEGIRLPAHHDRRPAILRHPKLPLHSGQTRPELLRRPGNAHRRPAMVTATSARVITPRQSQLPDQLLPGDRQVGSFHARSVESRP
ncbi:MAG TPA: transposase [Streptosporangiaceae bacterium]